MTKTFKAIIQTENYMLLQVGSSKEICLYQINQLRESKILFDVSKKDGKYKLMFQTFADQTSNPTFFMVALNKQYIEFEKIKQALKDFQN